MTKLKGLGITVEEALAFNAEHYLKRAPRDARICICGHPVSRHLGLQGEMLCKPTKMECPCRAVETVLETTDTRNFLWRTQGWGAGHALTRGLAAATSKGAESEWLDGVLVCKVCGDDSEDVELMPCAVVNSRISLTPQRTNGLLCRDCVEKVGVE